MRLSADQVRKQNKQPLEQLPEASFARWQRLDTYSLAAGFYSLRTLRPSSAAFRDSTTVQLSGFQSCRVCGKERKLVETECEHGAERINRVFTVFYS